MGAVAQSYMRKGFLIYEEIRKYLVIYDATAPFWISLYMRKILFSFYECVFMLMANDRENEEQDEGEKVGKAERKGNKRVVRGEVITDQAYTVSLVYRAWTKEI